MTPEEEVVHLRAVVEGYVRDMAKLRTDVRELTGKLARATEAYSDLVVLAGTRVTSTQEEINYQTARRINVYADVNEELFGRTAGERLAVLESVGETLGHLVVAAVLKADEYRLRRIPIPQPIVVTK